MLLTFIAWVNLLKDKKGTTITNAFQKVLKESNCKPNKIWVDKVSEFYNKSIKLWLEKNAIEMYSTHNEGKSVVPERFIRTLKNKIHEYMTSVSKNVYIDKLLINIIIHHNAIKLKSVDVKDPKLKVGDIVRISKHKNIFAKGYIPNWFEKVFVTQKVKNIVPWTYVISDLKGEKTVGAFYEKELKKKNQKEFRFEKLIKATIVLLTVGLMRKT